jgi:hypothetical protein
VHSAHLLDEIFDFNEATGEEVTLKMFIVDHVHGMRHSNCCQVLLAFELVVQYLKTVCLGLLLKLGVHKVIVAILHIYVHISVSNDLILFLIIGQLIIE